MLSHRRQTCNFMSITYNRRTTAAIEYDGVRLQTVAKLHWEPFKEPQKVDKHPWMISLITPSIRDRLRHGRNIANRILPFVELEVHPSVFGALNGENLRLRKSPFKADSDLGPPICSIT